jgi:hypothetical protein
MLHCLILTWQPARHEAERKNFTDDSRDRLSKPSKALSSKIWIDALSRWWLAPMR